MMKMNRFFSLSAKVMTQLLLVALLTACNPPVREESAHDEAKPTSQKDLADIYGEEMSLDKAIADDYISYVSSEVERLGTANIIVDDDMGWTALHCACHYGSKKTVQLLLSLGADPDIRDASGELPISSARKSPYSPSAQFNEILQLLSMPNQSFEPRSEEAEEAAALEAFIRYLAMSEKSREDAEGDLDISMLRSESEKSIKPCSVEMETTVQSISISDKTREEDDFPVGRYSLEINGRVVSPHTLEVLRGYGFKVSSGSSDSGEKGREEVRIRLEWVSDLEAKMWISGRFFAQEGKIYYTFGHWMLDIIDSSGDIF